MRTSYTSLKKVVSEYLIKSGKTDFFEEELAYIFANDAVDEIATADTLKKYILHDSLYNGKISCPDNFKYPLQVAYRKKAEPTEDEEIKYTTTEFIQRSVDENCEYKVSLVCSKCKTVDCSCDSYPIEIDATDLALASNPELALMHSRFLAGYSNRAGNYVSNINSEFTIIKPSSNYFFNLPIRIQNCQIPNIDNMMTYSIDDKILEVGGVLTGEILMSYLGRRIDENGFQMIPNEGFVFKAIEGRIMEGFALREYSMNPNSNTERAWMNMQMYAGKQIGSAKSKLRIPDMDQWDQILSNKLLKRVVDDLGYMSNQYTPDRYNPPQMDY